MEIKEDTIIASPTGCLPIGFILNERYRVEDILGRGGFGITYLCVDIKTDRRVAVKEFFPSSLCLRKDSNRVSVAINANEELYQKLLKKFIKEAIIIGELSSPNIVKVHGTFLQNDTAYYIMDYINGRSLQQIVRQNGALPLERAINYITKVGEALSRMHSKRINHLDVKPSNIIVRSCDDTPILIDFGVSKRYDIVGHETSTTPVGLSHGYSPLEQYGSGGVSTFSPQTDVYALSAVLYFLVTGIVPPNAPELASSSSVLTFPASVPFNVKNAIKRGMMANRDKRQKSVADFVGEIHTRPLKNDNKNEATILSVRETTATSLHTDSDRKNNIRSLFKFVKIVGIVVAVVLGLVYAEMRSVRNSANQNLHKTTDTISQTITGVSIGQIANTTKDDVAASGDVSIQVTESESNSAETAYNTISVGDGAIFVPKLLSYKGTSDNGDAVFSNTNNSIELFVDYTSYDLGMAVYHEWVTHEIGNGNPTWDYVSDNYFYQSGYNSSGEVYYTKAYFDNKNNPPTLYTATLIYDETEQPVVAEFIKKTFSSFPNLIP